MSLVSRVFPWAQIGIRKAIFRAWRQLLNQTCDRAVNRAGKYPSVAGTIQSFTPCVQVWLVDDNDELAEAGRRSTGPWEGIECARDFSSPDALLSELASKPGPDVILLDVQMGDRNGLDAVRPIKSLTRSTRVLMYTTCL